MHDAKQALRASTRAARLGLNDDERAEKSERAVQRLLALPELRTAQTVLLYAATLEECNPGGAWGPLLDAQVTVLFPRATDGDLVLAAANDEGGLAVGAFGLLEPVGPAVPATEVDVAVLPGLAFDRTGGRLGMGRGFYDRLVPSLRPDCLRVGFAYSCQMAARVPMEEHDQGVDVVVTEAAVHRMTAPPPATA